MITPKKSRYDTNWESELQAHDVTHRKEGDAEIKVVLLRGLQRLAHEAGIFRSECETKFISAKDTDSTGILQAIYTAEFSDGSKWVGTADCNALNTTGKFMHYPTAVAESRAEARCLRKALNISMLSLEEIGFADNGAIQKIEASPNKAIEPQVVKAIESLCSTRNIQVADVLDAVLSTKRNGSVFELGDLTVEEGGKALAWLNEQKPVTTKKKLTAAEEREARKKELLSQQDKEE